MSSSDVDFDPVVSSSLDFHDSLLRYADQLKVAHINCQSIRPSRNSIKFDEFSNIVKDNFEIIGVTETWLKPDTPDAAISLPGYNLVRNDRMDRRGGGVCIYVSDKLKYRTVSRRSLNGCESLFIEVCLIGYSVLFGVVYLPYGNIIEFEDSHNELFLEFSRIVIVGDFNCDMFHVSKAYLLRSMSLRCNLSVRHNSRPTYYDVAHGSTSLLDYWLVSDDSLCCFSDQVLCPSISHHSLIFAAFRFNYIPIVKEFEFRNFNNIDFDGIVSCISRFDSGSFFGSNCVDFQCSAIESLICDLFEYVPKVRRQLKVDDNNWIRSRNIVLATSLRDLAYSAFRRNRCATNWNIYCRYRNKAKNVIRKEKRRFFSRMFNGIDTAKIWGILRNSGVTTGSGIDADFNVDDINEFFADSSGSISEEIEFPSHDFSSDLFSFRCVDEGELFDAICKIKSKSVGVDGIPIRFIKIVFPYISHILIYYINSILSTSVFPKAWKLARVVPIPKSGRVLGLNDLRPISILPALSKALEHIIKDQMLCFVRDNISSSQYAFRRHHNTTSLLLDMTDDLRKHLNDGRMSLLVSLDLTKAFNSIKHSTMVIKLRELFHFSSSACRLVLSYLSDRSQFVDFNGQRSCLLPLHSGVPQGSVLGPLLFILYMNDLPSYINTLNCKPYLFADDVMLVFDGCRSDVTHLCSRVNFILERFVSWLSDNSLTINLSKTKALMCGTSCRPLPDIDVSIEGSSVEFVDHMKCLGVYIDKRLTFEYHVHMLQCKISGILRRLYSTNLYLPLRVRCQLAHSLLLSNVRYGLEVISGTFSYIISKINRIVNSIVRYTYFVPRRDHISSFVTRFLGCSFGEFVCLRNLYLFYKIMRNGSPSLLASKFTFSHSTRNPQIVIPRIHNALYEKSFVIRVARYWNHLPLELRVFSHSNNVFRLKLMKSFSSNLSSI